MNIHRHWIVSIFMSVNQAAGEFVIGVRRKTIVDEELGFRIQCLAVSFHQTMDLCLRRL